MDPHTTAAQLFFPHYKLDSNRSEIGLHEYDLAAKALEADHRSLTVATGIVVFLISVAPSLTSGGVTSNDLLQTLETVLGKEYSQAAVKASVVVVSILAIHYFAGLQKSATYAARKIVVLRRLLGLDYGRVETVLPSNRLDGANEPYSIEMFPGWYSLPALPVIIVALAAGATQGLVFISFLDPESAGNRQADVIIALVAHFLGTIMICLGYFRCALFDDFENLRFFLARALSPLFGTCLKKNCGYVLYRLRLSVYEAKRLRIDLKSFHELLVTIEDAEFYLHNGNSIRSIFAALWRFMRYRKVAGGSTIYQQLVRSNFLSNLRLPYRRKIFEWLLAPWLNRRFSKNDGLDAYLCSVRFDKGVIGIVDALRHFFPTHPLNDALTAAQRFFLVERLSNISGTYPRPRVAALANRMCSAGLLTAADVVEVDSIYAEMIARGLIRP